MSLRNGLVWLLFVALPALGADTEINVTNLTTAASMGNTDTFLVRTGATKALRVVSAMTAKSAGSNVVGAVSTANYATTANRATNSTQTFGTSAGLTNGTLSVTNKLGVGTNAPQAGLHVVENKAGTSQGILYENIGSGDSYLSLHSESTGDCVFGLGIQPSGGSWHLGVNHLDGSLHVFNNSFGSGTPYATFEATNSSRGLVTYRGIYDGTRIETAGPMVFGGASYFGNGNTLFKAPSSGLLKLTDWGETLSAQVQAGNIIVTNISAASQPSIALNTNGNITASGLLADAQNVITHGAKGDNTTDDTAAFKAAIRTALTNAAATVFIPPGTYKIASAFGWTNVSVFGANGAILNVSAALTNGNAITLGTNSRLSNLKIIGPGNNGGPAGFRPLALSSHCVAEKIWIDSTWSGIDLTGCTNTVVRDYRATSLHDSNGWANAIEAGAGTDGVYVDGISISNSDRGIETENGARNCVFRNGQLYDVYPGIAYTYGMSLDAHNHDAQADVTENIRFENFYLSNCIGITAQGNTVPSVRNVIFDNITIVSPSQWQQSDMTLTGTNITVRNCTVVGATNNVLVYLQGGTDVTFDNLSARLVPNLTINGVADGVRLANCSFYITNNNAYQVLVNNAITNLVVTGCTFHRIKPYGGLNTVVVNGAMISHNLFEIDTASPGGYGFRLGGTNLVVQANRVDGTPGTEAFDIGGSGTAMRGLIMGNSSKSGGIWMRTGSYGFVIQDNWMGTANTDAGTTNVWIKNGAFSTLTGTNVNVYGNITGTGTSNYVASLYAPTVNFTTLNANEIVLTNKIYGTNIIGDGITNASGFNMTSMADTNWVLAQVSQFGAYEYMGGPTNSFAITNTGESVSRTNIFTTSISPFVNSATQTFAGLVADAYVRTVISTNKFDRIAAGPVTIETYPYRTGGAGTVSGKFEFYAVDCVSNIMYELGASPTITISAAAPTLLTTSMVITNGFTATNRCYAAITFKVVSGGTGGATLSFVNGGNYPAHFNFARPLSSATINGSQISDGTVTTNKWDPTAWNWVNSKGTGTGTGIDPNAGHGTNIALHGTTAIDNFRLFSTPTKWVAYGDSITEGAYVTNSYVRWLTNMFAWTNLMPVNYAQSSYKLADVSNSFWGPYNSGSRSYTNHLPNAGTNSMMSFFFGINDVLYDTIDTNLWITGTTNMWWTAYTNGYNPVVLFTIEDCQLLDAGKQSTRSLLNTMLKSVANSNAAWMITIDNDIALPSTNSTFFLYAEAPNYGLHPNDYGQQQIALALASQLFSRSNTFRGHYVDGYVMSGKGFVGDATYLKNIPASQISGTVPATALAPSALITAGSGATVTPTTNSGVISYSVGVSGVAATSPFATKRVWSYAPQSTAVGGFGLGFANANSGGGNVRVQATTTTPIHLRYYTAATTASYYLIADYDANIVLSKAGMAVWRCALTNVSNARSVIGLHEQQAAGYASAENPTNTIRRAAEFVHWSTNHANWFFLTSTSGAGNYEWRNTGVAADTNPHTFKIEWSGTDVKGYIDGTAVATNTTYLTTSALFATAAVGVSSDAANALNFFQFYGESDW